MTTEQMAWGLVGGLLMIIGFFAAGWMQRTDRNVDDISKIVAEHEKEIAILRTEATTIVGDIQEIKETLKAHLYNEDKFQQEMRTFMRSMSRHEPT